MTKSNFSDKIIENHPLTNIAESWKPYLSNEFEKEYFQNLIRFIYLESQLHDIYPPASEYFNAFNHCSFDDLRVVILGQDPYHGPEQANGLCFSVSDGMRLPPSLKNIFKEVHSDLNINMPESGNLERWAKQGILLLNATLTVRAHTAGSHQKKGWEEFTNHVIKEISEKKENIVFLLWGSYAQKKGKVIDKNKHHILNSPHPSPLSAHRGFFGNKHFSKTNAYLRAQNKKEILW